jgi:hypothetical protein
MAAKAYTDEQLSALVERKIKGSVPFQSSKLSKEREKVYRYYNGEFPRRQSEGSSTYISTDVYDAVEAMKAQLLETFAAGYDIVKFQPKNEQDVEGARIATEYATYIVHQLNPGYDIFSSVIHDGLTARIGVVKVYWEDYSEYIDEEVEGLDLDQANFLAVQDDITELELELDEETGTYKGSLSRLKSDGKVCIDPIAPEEFGVDPTVKKLDKAFCYHRMTMTEQELLAMGVDKKKLENLSNLEEQDADTTVEWLARTNPINNGLTTVDLDEEKQMRQYIVYECYLDIAEGARKKLMKVLWCGNVVLDREAVEKRPFIYFRPLPIPHSFFGNNFAQRVISTQNAKTVLTRSILDHASITNNPRYTVLRGSLPNPREMLDNRLGGIVNVTRPDAVNPLLQAALNPFVFQTIEMLKMNNEQTTGISALSQGLDKNAISQQNSQGLVQDLVTLSQTRQKIVARNFAMDFLIPLYLEVYRLTIAHDKQQSVVELAGNWVPIDPRTWRERKHMVPALTLGYGEQDMKADKLTGLLALMTQDPETNRMLSANGGKYRGAVEVFKLRGFKDVNSYITDPSKLPPPEPDPEVELKKAELQVKQQELQLKAQELPAKAQEVQAKVQLETIKATVAQMTEKLELMKFELDKVTQLRDADRKDAQIANEIDISQREIAIAENAPVEATKPIASANS